MLFVAAFYLPVFVLFCFSFLLTGLNTFNGIHAYPTVCCMHIFVHTPYSSSKNNKDITEAKISEVK